MPDERVTERIVEHPATTVIETRKGGGAGIIIGIILAILVAVAVYFIAVNTGNEARESDAVSEAARDVGQAAESVGDAATRAIDEGVAEQPAPDDERTP
jgi:hypothetical protein